MARSLSGIGGGCDGVFKEVVVLVVGAGGGGDGNYDSSSEVATTFK